MNQGLNDLLNELRKDPEVWAERIEEELGLSLDDINKAAMHETVLMKRHTRGMDSVRRLNLALTGGIFIGLAIAMKLEEEKAGLATELESFLSPEGKEEKNDDQGT